MFGLGKDKGPKLVGAKEKLIKAQMLKRGRLGDHIESKGEGQKPWGATVALIYFIAVALAYVLQIGAMKSNGLNWHTGMNGFDHLMFSSGVPSITGVADQDMIIVPFLRGTVFFLLGGLLPITTLLWIRAIDKPNMNPFLAFWGVSIGVFLVFFFMRDVFGPIWDDLMVVMTK
ncbi:MAG: hypothetical protein EPN97_08140 [Alphaproteobacteria bacterium]|nr:MAG: hypothetical protein EPN97_08140 [Alphaproteobacteria bacterium]